MNIIIFDTGDNYILASKNASYQTAIDLYQMMDITVNPIETEYTVNPDIAQFIFDNIGTIISYGFNDTDGSTRIDIPEKLKRDIEKSIDFYKVRRFWSGVVATPSSRSNIVAEDTPNGIRGDISITGAPISFDSHIETPRQSDLDVTNTVIIYNTIYNLTLVTTIKNKDALLSTFKEFVMVEEISHLDSTHIQNLQNHFHKKAFSSMQDIFTKLKAFKELYNISQVVEKDRIKNYLEKHFTVSTDPDKRMKANDLYKEFINLLVIPYTDVSLFKKRMAGYLLEFGLQKKRFSDAYYYYGIVKNTVSTLDLLELERERDKERKDWFFKRDQQNSTKQEYIAGFDKECMRNQTFEK